MRKREIDPSALDESNGAGARAGGLTEDDIGRSVLLSPSRLAAVRASGLLDSEVEEVFDRLTRLAVRLIGSPVAFISLVDEERDFYKSAAGFGEPLASSRELTGPTFCHYTIQGTTPLVIPDTAADPVYRHVPTVRTLGVAAYVGVPILMDGEPIGAFCAVDTHPRSWSEAEVEVLVELAASAQREIELRMSVSRERAISRTLEQQRHELQQSNQQLLEQSAELAKQAAALQAASLQLQERTNEAESARRAAEEAQNAAEESNRAKGDFLAVMSHELRTPLNAIGGYAELVEMEIHGPVTADQRIALHRIRRSQGHLLGLINGVLNYAKIDAGVTEYDVEDVALHDVLSTCELLTAPQIASKRLRFLYTGCDGALSARADREKVQQIVLNLLANAIKFTDVGGQVRLDCAVVESGEVCVRVSDTGPGIAPEQRVRIFHPFVQVDALRTRAQEGTGLGLAISRALARGMGGEITLESELGTGSTFILTLLAS